MDPGPPDDQSVRMVDRLPPLVLGILGLVLVAGTAGSLADAPPVLDDPVRWWTTGFFLVTAGMMVLLGVAVLLDPRPLLPRRLLAAASILWLLVLVAGASQGAGQGAAGPDPAAVWILAGIEAISILALAAGTGRLTREELPGPMGRLGAVVALSAAIVTAAVTLAVLVAVGSALWDAAIAGTAAGRARLGMAVLVVLVPLLAFAVAAVGTRRAAGGTFYDQVAANRRNSLLLLVALAGTLAAVAELIVAAVTGSSGPALWAAGIATLAGLGAGVAADRFGAEVVLESSGARSVDRSRDQVLVNVVEEVALAAGIPAPRIFVIEEPSLNAFATGRDPAHAAVAVTRGLVERLDREALQGVIGHELGHVRNLDTRYALYIAVLVGLVAMVTDGFLRVIVEIWKRGGFFWHGDDLKSTAAAFASGIALGTFLLLVAGLLRLVAPFFSLLIQAAASREREFLADATSAELTRNPIGLERALAAIAVDDVPLRTVNRGTQHLWFRNPVKAGSDRRAGLLSTHPSIGARIERLRRLRGLASADDAAAMALPGET